MANEDDDDKPEDDSYPFAGGGMFDYSSLFSSMLARAAREHGRTASMKKSAETANRAHKIAHGIGEVIALAQKYPRLAPQLYAEVQTLLLASANLMHEAGELAKLELVHAVDRPEPR